MAILRNLFDDKYKISEKVASVIRSGPGIQPGKKATPQANSQTLYQTPAFMTPNPASNNTNNLPDDVSSSFWGQYSTPKALPIKPSGGGVLPSNPDAGTRNDPRVLGAQTDLYADTQRRLTEESQAREAQARQQASGIFDPLVSNVQSQIGRLGDELGVLRGGIERGSKSARDLVSQQLEAGLSTLGQQEQGVRQETGKTLRNLAEDQRNMTTSLARQLGARGAGDTSAGDYAGSAIGRAGLKGRGAALESQATGLREIEGRRYDAQNIANQENSRIEQAKQQQLTSLASDFQNLQRQLEDAKATASSDERRYIADQQNQLRDQLSERLSQLDGEARQRKAALQDWYAKQEAELQMGLQKVSQGARYDATNVMGNLNKAGSAINKFGTSLTPQGLNFIEQQYQVPSGLFNLPSGKEDEDEALLEALTGGNSQGFVPDNIPLIGRF